MDELEKLIKSGDFYEAGELCEKREMFDRAIGCYALSKSYQSAAELSERLGRTEQARHLYRLMLKSELELGDFEYAAHAAVKLGDVDKARQLLQEGIETISKEYPKQALDLLDQLTELL